MNIVPSPIVPNPEQEVVERVVQQLNAIGREVTFAFAFRVGQVVIENFYAGNMDGWRLRVPNKDVFFRKLSAHPDLPMSASALFRSVCIYELCERLGVRSWKHLSTSHIRLVLPLPATEQERVLRLAEDNAWSVRRLDEEVAGMRVPGQRPNPARGGPKARRALKAIRVVDKCSSAIAGLLHSLDDDLTSLPEEQIRAAIELVRTMRLQCKLLEDRLAPTMPGASTGVPPAFEDFTHGDETVTVSVGSPSLPAANGP
jgi:hypothetical protein